MYCKLIDAIDTPQTLTLAETKVVGGRAIAVYKPKRFMPGKLYEVPDDELFVRSLLNATKIVLYDAALEKLLAETGADFEVKLCKSCVGRVKKIEYHVLEVLDE